MLYSVITTVNPPTKQVIELAKRHKKENLGEIIIVGDRKGPHDYKLEKASLISINDQDILFPEFSQALPKNHYARKNIGYLVAMREGASCIYETDDDNSPNEAWLPRQINVTKTKKIAIFRENPLSGHPGAHTAQADARTPARGRPAARQSAPAWPRADRRMAPYAIAP
mgnify:CR=1 FL=1